MLVARGQTAESRAASVPAGGVRLRRPRRPVLCVGDVLSQRVAACRVETTLRGRWAPPIELVGGVSVWVGG